jgi:hypothetical protein
MLDPERATLMVGAGRAFTVTLAVPDALAYAEELFESGVYVTFSVSVPVASDPAGITMVALPLLKVVAAEV